MKKEIILGRVSNRLSDREIKSLKPKEKEYSINDGYGLHLLVPPSGIKYWRLRYKIDNRTKYKTIGNYPEVSLKRAREIRDLLRIEINNGGNPDNVVKTKQSKNNINRSNINTFEKVFYAWIDAYKHKWKSEATKNRACNSIIDNVLPQIGSTAIDKITAPMIMNIIKKSKTTSDETKRRIRGRLEAIFSYAIAMGLCNFNPASGIAPYIKPPTKGHYPSIKTLPDFKKLLSDIENTDADIVTKNCIRFIAITALRSTSARELEWGFLKENTLYIPASNMKGGRAGFVVPLPRQAIEIINKMKKINYDDRYIFNSLGKKNSPLSDNTLSKLLRENGYKGRHTIHGFRSSFLTIMNEKYPEYKYILNLMLAHSNQDKVEASYNFAEHLDKRAELLQIWANLII